MQWNSRIAGGVLWDQEIDNDIEQMQKEAFIEACCDVYEDVLFADFRDSCRLWLRGDNSKPTAYIEAAVFGNEGHAGYDALTAELTLAFHEVLGIPPENVYIKYDDITAWGVGGMYIDRRQFR